MALRIWHQSMTELTNQAVYAGALERHIGQVVDAGVVVDLHGVRPGTYGDIPPSQALSYPFAFHALLRQVLDLVMEAEDAGYDAVALASFAEPFLREARSIVDIPVVSMAESCLLTACTVARRSALISVTPETARMADAIVAAHGLRERVAGVYALDPEVDETVLARAFDDPTELLTSFRAACAHASADRADVFIPAEGILSEVLAAHQVRDIDGTSVMDGVAVVLNHAVMLAGLHRRTGLRPGRRWDYRRPPAEVLGRLRERHAE
ncbi:aspartate/glutamate racemase family protein [Streptomyces sp. NPDC055078]